MVTRLDRVVNYIERVHNFFLQTIAILNYQSQSWISVIKPGLAVATLNFNGREPATDA